MGYKPHSQRLYYTDTYFRNIIENNADGIIIVDRDGILRFANPAAEELFGIGAESLIGDPFGYLMVTDAKAEIEVIHKNGKKTSVEMRVREVAEGREVFYLASLRDITERKELEKELREAHDGLERKIEERASDLSKANALLKQEIVEREQTEDRLKASLKEKEVLLKEIHHRVKNNLQIISSLLNLQMRHIKSEEAKENFRESQNRIKSMALVHEKLYQSESLEAISFKEYMRSLIKHLFSSYGVVSGDVKFNINADDALLVIDKAIPCGLIVNEIVSNSLKHALLKERKGEISVQLRSEKMTPGLSRSSDGKEPREENMFILTIGNDGTKFPEDVDFRKTKSLGLQLVCALVEQLNGTIELDREAEAGTEFRITFPY